MADKNTNNAASYNASMESANVRLGFTRLLPFFGGALGSSLVWTVIMSFLSFYWTDVLGVTTGMVGTFLLVTKLFDAINDPIIGYISDKTQTRFGRYRPWNLSVIFIALFGVLTFTAMPGMSEKAQGWFSMIAYFIYVLVYTCMEVPGQGLIAAVTTDFRSRGQTATFRMCGSYLGSVVIGSSFLPLAMKMGATEGGPPDLKKGFFYAVLVLTCIALPLGLYQFAGVKERVKIPVSKHKLSESFKCLKGNGPFWIYFCAFLVYGITSGTTSARMYYWTSIFGDQGRMSANITSWIGGMACGSIIYFFAVRKVKNKATPAVFFFVITGLFNIALSLFVMKAGTPESSVTMFHALTAATGVVQGVAVSAMYGVLPDITEYTQWKYNFRISGFVGSILNCSYKWGLAIGSAAFVYIIGMLGYNAEGGVNQPEAVKTIINVFLHVIPAICFIGAGLIMTRYKIDVQKLEEMRAEIAQRKTVDE